MVWEKKVKCVLLCMGNQTIASILPSCYYVFQTAHCDANGTGDGWWWPCFSQAKNTLAKVKNNIENPAVKSAPYFSNKMNGQQKGFLLFLLSIMNLDKTTSFPIRISWNLFKRFDIMESPRSIKINSWLIPPPTSEWDFLLLRAHLDNVTPPDDYRNASHLPLDPMMLWWSYSITIEDLTSLEGVNGP